MRFFLAIFGMLLCLGLGNAVYAKAPELRKLHPNELGIEDPSGYEILLDQAFRISGGQFSEKMLFFGAKSVAVPKIFVTQGAKVLDSKELPGIVSASDLSEVKADGKIHFDPALNKKLEDSVTSKAPIKTIKQLKKFLSK